jgi:hypothetical protein
VWQKQQEDRDLPHPLEIPTNETLCIGEDAVAAHINNHADYTAVRAFKQVKLSLNACPKISTSKANPRINNQAQTPNSEKIKDEPLE